MFAEGTLLGSEADYNNIKITDYESISLLGSGSFGRVYLMINKINNTKIAVKVLSKATYFTKSQGIFNLLKQEISIHSRLVHPHIIRLYGHSEDLKNIYMMMEYVNNGTLQDRLKGKGRLNEEDAFNFFKQICDAVNFLHKNKLLHRDLKPGNILITKEGEVKLTDFGCCIQIEKEEKNLCGTPQYIAPEVIRTKKYNEKSDIWSLGILLYEMLYGAVPFTGDTIEKILENILINDVILDSSISSDANELLRKMTDRDPTKRITIDNIVKSSWVKRMISGGKLEEIEKKDSPSLLNRFLSFWEGDGL